MYICGLMEARPLRPRLCQALGASRETGGATISLLLLLLLVFVFLSLLVVLILLVLALGALRQIIDAYSYMLYATYMHTYIYTYMYTYSYYTIKSSPRQEKMEGAPAMFILVDYTYHNP